jgi:hypothetical protein
MARFGLFDFTLHAPRVGKPLINVAVEFSTITIKLRFSETER